jgi:hypothetical protein
LYSKQLARTVAGRKLGNKTEERERNKEKRGVECTLEKKKEAPVQEIVPEPLPLEETPLDEDENADQSLWCGDEDEPAVQETDIVETGAPIPEPQSQDEDGEDEDPVVQTTNRRRGLHVRAIQIDSDDEEEVMEEVARMDIQFQRADPRTEPMRQETAIEIAPLLASRPPHRKGKSTISNWAQEVIDLTSSPPPQAVMSSPHYDEGAMLHLYVPHT